MFRIESNIVGSFRDSILVKNFVYLGDKKIFKVLGSILAKKIVEKEDVICADFFVDMFLNSKRLLLDRYIYDKTTEQETRKGYLSEYHPEASCYVGHTENGLVFSKIDSDDELIVEIYPSGFNFNQEYVKHSESTYLMYLDKIEASVATYHHMAHWPLSSIEESNLCCLEMTIDLLYFHNESK